MCATSLWKMCVDTERQTVSLLLMIIVLWFLGSSINLLRCMHDFFGSSWIWSAKFLQVTCFLHLGSSFLELAGNSEKISLWERIVTSQVENKFKAFSDPWPSPEDLCFHLWDIQSEKIWQSDLCSIPGQKCCDQLTYGRSVALGWSHSVLHRAWKQERFKLVCNYEFAMCILNQREDNEICQSVLCLPCKHRDLSWIYSIN